MNLLQAYKYIKPAIGKGPLLTSIKIEASANRMMLTASNLTFSLSAVAEYDGEPFAACVNGKLLGEALERLQTPDIRCADSKIVLSQGRARISLATSSVNDFPTDTEYTDTLTIDVPRIAHHLQQVFYAAADKDIRYYLNGVQLQGVPGSIIAIATDGHRMAVSRLEADAEPFDIIIPRESARELIALDPASMVISLHNGQAVSLTAERADKHLSTKLVEGKFPDWRRVLPNYTRYVSTARKALITALGTLKPFAGASGVQIAAEEEMLHLSVLDVSTSATGEDYMPYEGDPSFAMGFNIGYLADAMQGMTSDAVTIQFGDAENVPVRLDDGEYTAIISPMRI
jgi:DNA polymerase-3 subunit beta